MNPIDIKTKIEQNKLKLLERKDDRIIIYDKDNNPIHAFDNLEEMIKSLNEWKKISKYLDLYMKLEIIENKIALVKKNGDKEIIFLQKCLKDLGTSIINSYEHPELKIPSDSALFQSASRIINNFFYKEKGDIEKIKFRGE